MNREEASFILANIDRRVCDDELNEALDMAIKALDQEPCDNAVSRQDVLDLAKKGVLISNGSYKSVCKAINELPPVNPTNTGHWIDDNENEIDAQYGRHLYRCSKCNEYADMFIGGTEDWWDLEKPNYCPNCGRRMVEPQESERV